MARKVRKVRFVEVTVHCMCGNEFVDILCLKHLHMLDAVTGKYNVLTCDKCEAEFAAEHKAALKAAGYDLER